LTPGAHPVGSAALIAQHAGLAPKWTASYPLWSALVKCVAQVPSASLAVHLNILSAVCGALSIFLLYTVVSGVVFSVVHLEEERRPGGTAAARLAGISASLCLAFAIPFWVVSNRAHMASFHLLLLLAAAWLFASYAKTGSRKHLGLLCLLWGLGVVEFATFIVFSPLVFPVLAFVVWWYEEEARARMGLLFMAIGCVLLGLTLYLGAAWWFYGSEGYVAKKYQGFFQVVWFIWRDQYIRIARSIPRVGWLIVILVGVMPWLACLTVGRRSLNEERGLGFYGLHVLMTIVAVAVVLNHELAPWPMLGHERLLVTPYLLIASLYGYLVAYWYLVPGTWWPDPEARLAAWAKKWLGIIMVIPGLALLCIAPARNLAEADGRPAAFISRYAAAVVDSVEDCTWLVTEGAIDSVIAIAARDKGRDLRLLDLRSGREETYTRYISTFFAEPRYRNLARISLLQLLQEWLGESDAVGKVAVLWPSDLWVSAECAIVPNKLVFFGTSEVGELDAAAMLREHEEFWDEMVPVLEAAAENEGLLSPYARYFLRHVGMVANNLGVLAEDLGNDKAAESAYARARKIDPENVSALLNLAGMTRRGLTPGRAESVKNDVEALLAGGRTRYRVWALSRNYGYVRSPELFTRLGWAWVMSGRPGMAVSGMMRAAELQPDEDRRRVVRRSLADIYVSRADDEKAATLYAQILKEKPGDGGALVGLARIAVRRGRFEQARALLERAERGGMPKVRMAVEWSGFHLAAGELGRARILLEEAVDLNPGLGVAWEMLVDALVRQRDRNGLEHWIREMEFRDMGGDYLVLIARGWLAFLDNDLEHARNLFQRALNASAGNPRLLEWLVELDIRQERLIDAEKHASQLLAMDRGNAPAYYVIGCLQMNRGEDDLAEDSFRRSIELGASPHALNNLAWLLQERNEYEEAERHVRAALELNDNLYQAWDTLGLVLMRRGQLEEAQQALDRAAVSGAGHPNVLMNLADLSLLRNDPGRARQLVETVSSMRSELTAGEEARLDEIKRRAERADAGG